MPASRVGALLPAALLFFAGAATALPVDQPAADGLRIWQVLLALLYVGGVAALGYGLVQWLKRRGLAVGGFPTPGTQEDAIRVRSVKRLTPSAQAILMQVDQQQVLVVIGPSGISTTRLDAPHAP